MTNMESGAARVMSRADILATYSESPEHLTRAYLTPEHRNAHDQLAQWMTQAGLETWQDSVGNQWGRKVSSNPTMPTLLLGSHSDTVANAGKYDGNLGVILGLEALALLKDVELPYHVDVVAFADEEGTRFNTTLIGSSSVAGCFQPSWLEVEDAQGISMGKAMHDFGLAPTLAGHDARVASDILAYLEVHIEQGPVLEAKELPVGVVTGIAGAKRYEMTVKGMAGHAGTVPISLRQDAFCGMAQMASEIEAYALSHNIVATIGKCDVLPGAVNVIPGEVRFTLDIRSLSQVQLEQCCDELLAKLANIAAQRNLSFSHRQLYQAQAVPCDDALQQRWASVVEKHTQQTPCFLPSGAGHDAMVMANVADIGMLFVRCDRGISHHPAESVMESDVAVALDCFTDMIQSFAN
ncbi:allantoate amidohydrolase [Vibrio olivae]|uniref:Allantoate amidohydrolase n=1 Tax=Vibrio olivae TaxID=1243002 RepID=A0ABV5HSS9_9VIBR